MCRFALSTRLKLCIILTVLLLATITQATPSSSALVPQILDSPSSEPLPSTVPFHRRSRTRQVTIANGWHIHYRLFAYVTPALPALLDFRKFYSLLIEDIEHRISSGEVSSAIIEMSRGAFTPSFEAEKGFVNAVDWGIVAAFVEKMLEMAVPTMYVCRIAPPGSALGFVIKMWVGPWMRVGDQVHYVWKNDGKSVYRPATVTKPNPHALDWVKD
ncbi:MAG: hypothetical protein Q9170_006471 [Blastenia crenularia]